MNKSIKRLFVSLLFCLAPSLTGCNFAKTFSASLNLQNVTLELNEEKQLVLTNVLYNNSPIPSSNYSYTWTSDNNDVASVDQKGLVTAKSTGITNVKANVLVRGYSNLVVANCKFTVIDTLPVSVSLNKTQANVELGKSVKLVATVEHSTNFDVLWSSSNPEILVNNGVVSTSNFASIGDKATITATSVADPSAKATCEVEIVEKRDDYDYTVMFYMSGSSLEYDGTKKNVPYPGLFSQDIQEMLDVDLPDNVKVIIETGGTKLWALDSKYIDGATSISNRKLQRWEIISNKISLVETLETNHMADESSFKDFLDWGLKNYSAKQMGVVLSGHGAGIAGCLTDDNYTYTFEGESYGNVLDTKEIASAANEALVNNGYSKFTWIGFDCCLMDCADIASVLSKYFDYMVASQENEIGEGWTHDKYLSKIADDSEITPVELLPTISKTAVESAHSKYCSDEPFYETSAVLDLTKMSDFTAAFNDYVNATGTKSTSYNKYKAAFKVSYNMFGEKVYGLADFKDFMNNLQIQFPTVQTDAVLTALSNLVIENQYCSNYKIFKPCGLNAFFPVSMDKRYGLQPSKDDYTGSLATKFIPYQDMCLAYGDFYW